MESYCELGDAELTADWNIRFMLALDCYLPVVARDLFEDCRDDIRLFGFDYAKEKWEAFIVNSLTGGIKARSEEVKEYV